MPDESVPPVGELVQITTVDGWSAIGCAAAPSPVIAPLTPTRTVYVTVRCPGCGVDSEWLGIFADPAGGTRYVPGECGCGVEVAA